MVFSYKRNLNHNYMIIEEKGIATDNYEIKMIMQNEIPCFLPVSIRYQNGEAAICYEISSKQPMRRIFENTEIGYEELKQFLFQLHKTLQAAEEYLINTNHLILNPEYLYMNIETNQIAVAYFPDYQQNAKEEFQKLAEYFLERVNHKDEKAVILAYQIYRNTRNKNFVLEEILNLSIENTDSETEFETTIKSSFITNFTQDDIQLSVEKTDSLDIKNKNITNSYVKEEVSNTGDKGTDKKYYGIAGIMLTGIIAILYGRSANMLHNLSYDQFLITVGACAMILIGCVLKIIITSAKKKLEADEQAADGSMQTDRIIDTGPDTVKEEKEAQSDNSYLDWDEIPEEKEAIKIYDFIMPGTSDINESMVAEDNSYGSMQISKDTFGLESGPYLGDTMLISDFSYEERREITGGARGKEITYSLTHFPFIIGKKESCVDLELKDSSISRMHARFIEKSGAVYLEDLNSTNGTFKNGMRLEANEIVKVEAEDEISFAKLVFTYH